MNKHVYKTAKDPYFFLHKLRRNHNGMLDRIYKRKHPLVISAKLPTCIEEPCNSSTDESFDSTNITSSYTNKSPVRRNDSYSCNSSPRNNLIDDYPNVIDQRPSSAESGAYDDLMQTGESCDIIQSNTSSISPRPHQYIPPGPPSSPNPSLTINTPNASSQEMSPTGTSHNATSKFSNQVMRLRLRERRNAVCDSTALSKGLRDFFVSYVMSDLTESMTSSLKLENKDKQIASKTGIDNYFCTSSEEDMINSDTSLCEGF